MAVKLYEMKRLSSGMAAALLGIERVTFLLKLSDYGVPMIDLTEEELLSGIYVCVETEGNMLALHVDEIIGIRSRQRAIDQRAIDFDDR